MTDNKFEIIFSSDERFEHLVAEIYVPRYWDGLFLAGVRRSDADDAFVVEIRGPYISDMVAQEVELDLLVEALQAAKHSLEDG